MAIWQVCIKVGFIEKTKQYNSIFTETLYRIIDFLPEEKSWCPNIKQFGSLESTCLEIYVNDNIIETIDLRIDLRNIKIEHLIVFCDFFSVNDYYLIYKDVIYKATLKNLLIILKDSFAYSFLKEPEKFLANQSGDG